MNVQEIGLARICNECARNRMCEEDSVHERLHEKLNERLCYMFSHFITYDIMLSDVNLSIDIRCSEHG